MSKTDEVNNSSDASCENCERGQPAFIGFEYQIIATVWIALVTITTGKSEAVIVEPAETQEDVEIDLNVPKEKADSGVRAGQVEIQIKFRSMTAWKAADFKKLLSSKPKKGDNGPSPRIRPLEYLSSDPSKKYILLTNTTIESSLKDFKVSSFDQLSNALRIPYGRKDDPELAGRIGVMPMKSEELIIMHINEILLRKCHVPGDNLSLCIDSLKEDVRERLRGKVATRFSKADLFGRIREFGGKNNQPIEPVHPVNYGNMEHCLNVRNALILLGPPGTGKTTLAESFVSKYERRGPPYKLFIVKSSADIPEVRRLLSQQDNHIFFFEDPWGSHALNPEAPDFTSQLPRLLADAHCGKVFVVTSRKNIFCEAIGDDASDFQPYIVNLNETDYDKKAFVAIYSQQIQDWPYNDRRKALSWRNEALNHILTPLAVKTFCSAFRQRLETTSRFSPSDIKEMADSSNVKNVSRVLYDMLSTGGDNKIAAAILIWAQLNVSQRKMTAQDAKDIRHIIRDHSVIKPLPYVEQVFGQMADAGWLQSRSTGYVAHPCVCDALAQFEKRNPELFVDTVEALFRGWSDASQFSNILSFIKESKGKSALIPEDLGEAFDNYLISVARKSVGSAFIYACRDINNYSKTQDPVVILARSLFKRSTPAHKDCEFTFFYKPHWVIPDLNPEVIYKIEKNAKWFAKRFVLDYLASETWHFQWGENTYDPDDLLTFFNKFDWPVVEWFRQAYVDSLHKRDDSSSYLATCLCKIDDSAIDMVFDSSLNLYKDVIAEPQDINDEKYEKAEQGEADAIPDGYDDYDDSCYSIAQSLLTETLRIKRQRDGYEWIGEHSSFCDMLYCWGVILKYEPISAEHDFFIQLCDKCSKYNYAFSVIAEKADCRFTCFIITHLMKSENGISCQLSNALKSMSEFPDFLADFREASLRLNLRERTLVAWQIISNTQSVFDKMCAFLPDDEQRIITSCYDASRPLEKQQGLVPHDEDYAKLNVLVDSWTEIPAIYALDLLKRVGINISEKIERFLSSSTISVRAHAWRLCEDRRKLLSEGIFDCDCNCRISALQNLAYKATKDERILLIKLVEDRSAFVRIAISECIGAYQWKYGIESLLGLLRDSREFGEGHQDDDYWIFEVARAACNALNRFPSLKQPTLGHICDFLAGCRNSSVDKSVHGRLFRILSKFPCEFSMQFCSDYINRIWFKNKWGENRGLTLFIQCCHTIIQFLLQDPDLDKFIDDTIIFKIIGYDNANEELVGSLFVIVALTGKTDINNINEIAVLDSFNETKASLLLALSSELQKCRPQEIMQYISTTDPFIELIDWTTKHNPKKSFHDFCKESPNVLPWVEDLQKKNSGTAAYERWAVNHLIAKAGALPEGFILDLPHPYRIP